MINVSKFAQNVEPKAMRKFNKSIQIEVQVDEIADKLLAEFSSESAHKNIIVESIIGNMLAKSKLGNLYSALNGYQVKIDFVVGQILNCTYTTHTYNTSKKGGYTEIGTCKVVEINEYEDFPIKVEYQYIDSDNCVKTSIASKGINQFYATDAIYGCLKPRVDDL